MENKKIEIFSIIFFIFLLFFFFSYSSKNSSSHSRSSSSSSQNILQDQKKFPRITEYCYFNHPEGVEGNYSSLSSSSSSSSSWKLFHVIINLRHGDRTSIHSLGSNMTISSNIPSNHRQDVQVSQLKDSLERVKSYQLNVLQSKRLRKKNKEYSEDNDENNPLNTLFTVSDDQLPPGQLTSHGFLQLVNIGTFLRDAYSSLLAEKSSDPTNIVKVRSTNYNRTIQSVAGFLSTFLPNVRNIQINYHLNEREEVMLGSLKHFIVHDIDEEPKNTWSPFVTKVQSKKCPRAEMLLRMMQTQGYSSLNSSTIHALRTIFGDNLVSKYHTTELITEVADMMLPRYCNNQPLPCGPSGLCVDNELLEQIMREADKSFCETFTSSSGGFQYTLLDIYPFIMELRETIVEASKLYNDYPPFHVFAGHDTVIAPVLAVLGIYQSSQYCVWPHYASRLLLELWKNEKYPDTVYIRIVYNGKDVTSLVPSCVGNLIHDEKATFCPLESFLSQIDHMLSPYRNRGQACLGKNRY